MGVILHNASFIDQSRGRKKYHSILLSRLAADRCLKEVNFDTPLGCLINTGIFREKHIGEPAIATLIHGGMKLQTGEPFCFDLNNGRTGIIHALESCCNMINNGLFEAGMVVSGDSIPTRRDRKIFPYASAASALLIKQHPDPIGFVKFYHRSFDENIELYSSELHWQSQSGKNNNKHLLQFRLDDHYKQVCQAMTKETIASFLNEEQLDLGDFDLILSTLDYPGVHTAGLGKALVLAQRKKTFYSARNILLIAAGAGIEVSLAWYKNTADE